jgi:hypothetical protein
VSILKDIGNIFTGGVSGLANKIIDTAVAFFPPSMSDAEKAKATIALKELAHKEELELLNATNEATQLFNQRVKEYEGTANDLKSIPIIGALIIFLRGAFRPLFAYAIAFVDIKVFSNAWQITDPQILSAFWLVNLLVLGFFFGERTMKNILPLLKEFLKK